MVQVATINDSKQIVEQFAAAVRDKDYELIASLLAEDGEFHTQDSELNSIDNSNKAAFMQWLIPALSATTVEQVDYDQCLHCKIGNPVVLFNGGKFPPVRKDSSSVSTQGLMLDIADGLIKEISFCYTFLSRENKYQFECNGEEIKKLIAKGMPLKEAVNKVLTERGYKDIRSTSGRKVVDDENTKPYIDRY